MPLFARPDATPVTDAPMMRRFMPHIMPSRTGAANYFHANVDVEATLAWLDDHPDVSFFQLFQAAMARTLHERPRLNRFVKGGVLYQRNHVALTFAVKKGMHDDAHLTTMKVRFEPGDDVYDVADRIAAAVERGRSTKKTKAEKKMSILKAAPSFVLGWMAGTLDFLDRNNLLPASMIASDPLYTSACVSNLGSLGIDATFHHLNDHGTCSVNLTIGKIDLRPLVVDGELVARRTVDLKFSLDDRVCDGFYCARTLERLVFYLQNPDTLVRPERTLKMAA